MANPNHIARLMEGVTAWNTWREENNTVRPDLSGAKLSGTDLRQANLGRADLRKANLRGANLNQANLRSADIREASSLTQRREPQ